MMTRTETITRLCELVAEIEEIRSNIEEWWVGNELRIVGEKLQNLLQTMQEQQGMKKPNVTITVPLNGSILRRLNMCKEKGLTMNEISAIAVLHDMYDDFAAPIYDAWLKQSEEGGAQ